MTRISCAAPASAMAIALASLVGCDQPNTTAAAVQAQSISMDGAPGVTNPQPGTGLWDAGASPSNPGNQPANPGPSTPPGAPTNPNNPVPGSPNPGNPSLPTNPPTTPAPGAPGAPGTADLSGGMDASFR